MPSKKAIKSSSDDKTPAASSKKPSRPEMEGPDGRRFDKPNYFEDALKAYGFDDSHCHNCGKHNSEISGLLMQCGKCKKAYYCSMKCFNDHLPTHSRYCQTGALDQEPEKRPWEMPQREPAPVVLAEKIKRNLYKLVIKDTSGGPWQINALDDSKHKFTDLEQGCYFRYTDAGTGPSRQNARSHPEYGPIRDLHGHGELAIHVTNPSKKKAATEVQPEEPSTPTLKLTMVNKEKRIYRVTATDESEEPVNLIVQDGQGHVFSNIEHNDLFRYSHGPDGKSRQGMETTDEQGEFHSLEGAEDLIVTAISQAGKKSRSRLRLANPPVPDVFVEDMSRDVRKLVVTDDPGYPIRTLEGIDANGRVFEVTNGMLFQYMEAPPKGPSTQHEVEDATFGIIQKLRGTGELTFTAVNTAGKKGQFSIQPSQDKPPLVSVELLPRGFRRLVVKDNGGEPITNVIVTDSKGHKFQLENNDVFSYLECGQGISKELEEDDSELGRTKKLLGNSDLTISATNAVGKTATATLPPTMIAPELTIEDIGNGLHRIVVKDEIGDVAVEVMDSHGNSFKADNGTIFSYTDCGNSSSKQKDAKDPIYGNVQKIRGRGDLTIKAVNPAGQTAEATVHADEGAAPKIVVEDVDRETGLKRLVCSDPDEFDELVVRAVDEEGQVYEVDNNGLFRYFDRARAPNKQEIVVDPTNNFRVRKIRGGGDLIISVENSVGKTADARVKPLQLPPPRITVKPVSSSINRLEVTDDSGEPVVLTATASGRPVRVENNMLFSYIQCGNSPPKEEEYNDSAYGATSKIFGSGPLEISATNVAGMMARATVEPLEIAPSIAVESLKNNLKRLVVKDELGGPLEIVAVDGRGTPFRLHNGDVFAYSECGKAPSKQEKDHDGKFGDVQRIFGSGDLVVTATNQAQKSASARVKPDAAKPPLVALESLGNGLKRLVVNDELGGPLEIVAVDERGTPFRLHNGDVLAYSECGKAPSKQEKDHDGKFGDVQRIFGSGDLVVTATNQAQKSASARVKPDAAKPPLVTLESLGNGLKRLVVNDELGGPLEIVAVDGRGTPFRLHNGDVLAYSECGKAPSKQEKEHDGKFGDVQRIFGSGDLVVTATNQAQKSASARVKPDAAKPPLVTLESLGNGLKRLVVNDELGGPLEIVAVDGRGTPFRLHNGDVLAYSECGKAPSKQEKEHDGKFGDVQRIFGSGDLVVTATNQAQKSASARVKPDAAKPPLVALESLGNGLKRLVVNDELGGPLEIVAVDERGTPFRLHNGDVLAYSECGKAPSKQEKEHDGKFGDVQRIFGSGDLVVTATNQAQKSASARVKPEAAKPPSLVIESLGSDLYRIVADDDLGDVGIEMFDESGNRFTAENGTVFSYGDCGNGQPKQACRDGAEAICGHGDLTIKAINPAGKTREARVHPTEAPSPDISVREIEPGLFMLQVDDKSGGELELTGYAEDGTNFSKCMYPGALFTYTESGCAPSKCGETIDNKHGKVHDLLSNGVLTVKATNEFGKSATAQVTPRQAPIPNLNVEQIEPGLYKVVASNETGGPLRIEAVCDEKKIGELSNGSLFCFEQDKASKEEEDETKHGKAARFQGPAPELWIYCYNEAGKKAKINVPARKRKPREPLPDLDDFNFKSDGFSYPIREKKEEQILTKAVADKLIFWYGRLGHPDRDSMKRRVAKLPPSCGIVPDDVDLMPWIIHGTMLNTKRMHEIIAELE